MTTFKRLKVVLLILALIYSCSDENARDVRTSGHERIDTVRIGPIPNFTDTTSVKIIPLE